MSEGNILILKDRFDSNSLALLFVPTVCFVTAIWLDEAPTQSLKVAKPLVWMNRMQI